MATAKSMFKARAAQLRLRAGHATPTLQPPHVTPTLQPPHVTPTLQPPHVTPTLQPPHVTPTLQPPHVTPTLQPPHVTPTLQPPPHHVFAHLFFAGEEPAASSRTRDIELAGLQSRLTASNAELQRLNAERDSLVATMAVVDDVHARALQQVRGEAEAASQVRA